MLSGKKRAGSDFEYPTRYFNFWIMEQKKENKGKGTNFIRRPIL